jgi:hypothetical protein
LERLTALIAGGNLPRPNTSAPDQQDKEHRKNDKQKNEILADNSAHSSKSLADHMALSYRRAKGQSSPLEDKSISSSQNE